jgi:ribosomal protein S11
MQLTKRARDRAAALMAHEAAHATAVEQLIASVQVALRTPKELRPARPLARSA